MGRHRATFEIEDNLSAHTSREARSALLGST